MSPEQGWKVTPGTAGHQGKGHASSPLSALCLPLRHFLHAFGWPAVGSLQDGPSHSRTEHTMKGIRLARETCRQELVGELTWGGQLCWRGLGSRRCHLCQRSEDRALVIHSRAFRIALFYGARLSGKAWWVWLNAGHSPSLSPLWLKAGKAPPRPSASTLCCDLCCGS